MESEVTNIVIGAGIGAVAALLASAMTSLFQRSALKVQLAHDREVKTDQLTHDRYIESRSRRTETLENLVLRLEQQSSALTTVGTICNVLADPAVQIREDVSMAPALSILTQRDFRRYLWAVEDMKTVQLVNTYTKELSRILDLIIVKKESVADSPAAVDEVFGQLYKLLGELQMSVVGSIADLNGVSIPSADGEDEDGEDRSA